jgi:hypothetical protein
MADALWLALSLPQWYFSTIVAALSGSWLTALPASGIVALVVGIGFAIFRSERQVLWNIVLFLLAELYVALSGLLRGTLDDGTLVWLPLGLLSLGIVIWSVVRARQSRLATILIGWFSLTYVLLAGLVGAMGFSDTWM